MPETDRAPIATRKERVDQARATIPPAARAGPPAFRVVVVAAHPRPDAAPQVPLPSSRRGLPPQAVRSAAMAEPTQPGRTADSPPVPNRPGLSIVADNEPVATAPTAGVPSGNAAAEGSLGPAAPTPGAGGPPAPPPSPHGVPPDLPADPGRPGFRARFMGWLRPSWPILLVVLAATFLYIQNLDKQEGLYFDESYYVYFGHQMAAGTFEDPCWAHDALGERPLNWEHPPLVKLIMAGSVKLGDIDKVPAGCRDPHGTGTPAGSGPVCYTTVMGIEHTTGKSCFDAYMEDLRVHGNAWSWRLPPAILGIMAVAFAGFATRRILRSDWAGALAAGLVLLDGLVFTSSRIVLLDIFATGFAMLALWSATFPTTRGRLGAGIALGLAFSCKYTAVAAGLPVLLVALWSHHRVGQLTRRNFDWSLVTIIFTPALVWILSYMPWWVMWIKRHGVLWAVEHWVRIQGAAATWDFKGHMEHTYSSQPHEWFLMQRPVYYYLGPEQGGRYEYIFGMGNPALWWAAAAGIVGVMVWVASHGARMARLAIVRNKDVANRQAGLQHAAPPAVAPQAPAAPEFPAHPGGSASNEGAIQAPAAKAEAAVEPTAPPPSPPQAQPLHGSLAPASAHAATAGPAAGLSASPVGAQDGLAPGAGMASAVPGPHDAAAPMVAPLPGSDSPFATDDRQALLVACAIAVLAYLPFLALQRTSFAFYMTMVVPFLAVALAAYIHHNRRDPSAFGWVGGVLATILLLAWLLLPRQFPIPGASVGEVLQWIASGFTSHLSGDFGPRYFLALLLCAGLAAVGFAGAFSRRPTMWAKVGAVWLVALVALAFLHYWPILQGVPLDGDGKREVLRLLPWTGE